jgi:hypothetical protein
MKPVFNHAESVELQLALAELTKSILEKFPDATFEIGEGQDPEGVYLIPTVDVDDTEEVFDLVVERLLHLQIERGLPIYVFPIRPLKRVIEILEHEMLAP